MPATAEAGLAGAVRPGVRVGLLCHLGGRGGGVEGRHLAQWGSAQGPEPLAAAWRPRAQAGLTP